MADTAAASTTAATTTGAMIGRFGVGRAGGSAAWRGGGETLMVTLLLPMAFTTVELSALVWNTLPAGPITRNLQNCRSL